MSTAALRILAVLLAALAAACTRPAAPANGSALLRAPETAPAAPGGAPPAPAPAPAPVARDDGAMPDDASWGDPAAPVTIVEFTDLQCPFCGRAQPTVSELARRYGPDRLRIVVKHYPLPFHRQARPAAEAARAVLELRGSPAFFDFVSKLFAGDPRDLDDARIVAAAAAVGVSPAALDERRRAPHVAERIDRDVALAEELGVHGTPHFLVNGLHVSGAVPVDELAAYVDRELAAADALRGAGMPAEALSAARARENLTHPPPPPVRRDEDETIVWNVPVAGSPTLGPPTALVTIVEFSDFQCPFCKRVQPTLEALRQRYGDDLRLVYKHLPLGFHPRARPAALLANAARRRHGDAGFWKATAALYDRSPELDDTSLQELARKLSLPWADVRAALSGGPGAAELEADEALARDSLVRGTPHFFINGRRLVGAVPLEEFIQRVDLALVEARAVVQQGVPRAALYDELLRRNATPSAP